MNTGVTFNLIMRKKTSMKKIIRLILEEVVMSDGHMSDGEISFLQLFLQHGKYRLTPRLDSTVTDHVLLIFIVIPL